MQDLHVALIQSDLYWESPEANRAMFEEKIWQIKKPVDIIILPEMFTTGFSMQAVALAEVMNMSTFKWMKQMAAQTEAVLVGSYIVKEGEDYYNRLLWMQPDGAYDFYDKKHLFRLGQEHENYRPGTSKIIKEWKGWRICPLICYDLRFPVWSRNVAQGYDLLLYVANWPIPRIHAWDTLLQARAIENIAYSIGVNRLGKDGGGMEHPGHSAIYNYKGEVLAKSINEATTLQYTLSKSELLQFRERFPFHLDADNFELQSK